jgi:outer membrane protein assembly factor BamB
MHPLRYLALSLALLMGFSSATFAQEWSRFRGPNGTGLSDSKFAPKFAPTDFSWKIELPGGGHSSPVLWGKKLFIACCDDHTARRTLLCINADDGSTIWRRDVDSQTHKLHMNNSYASGTPAVDGEHVYICWSTPAELTVMAYNMDGTDAWNAPLGAFISQHGGGQSPIVMGDLVLLTDINEGPSSYLFGLDRKTGQVRWRTPMGRTDKFCPASPCLYQPAGGPEQAIFLSKVEGFSGIDLATGKILWETPGVFDARAVGSPLIWHDLIIGACGDNGIGHQLAAVHPGTAASPASKAWVTGNDTPYVPTMLIKNDLLFCWNDIGVITCRQPATGKVIWQQRVPGTFFGSPVCADQTIYALSQKGEVVSIAAKDKFELLGRTPLEEKSNATPAIAEGKMFFRTYTHLSCVKANHN